MTTQDPRIRVEESIVSAISELSDALASLDKIPIYDKSAVGFVGYAMGTYLSVSRATLELIERAVIERSIPEVGTWLEGLRHLGYLMEHTVARLMHTSPAEFPLRLGYVNLSVLIERACDHHRRAALERRLRIVCRTVGDVPPVWADRVATAVVADILLSNAIQASKPDGDIIVQIMPGPGGVVCSLRDHGRGLSPLEAARLFEYATEPEPLPTDVDGPTVHGLAIAKRFVERMGGRLWAESEPGKGTTMSFRLPYQPPEVTPAAG